jgi:hypothetical protein
VSTYPTAPVQSMGAPAAKPATLKAAVLVAVVAGLAAIADAAVILVGGLDLAKEIAAKAISDATGTSVEEITAKGGRLLDFGAKEVQDALNSRAYLLLVPGVLVLLFGALMNKGALWARILVTISGAIAIVIAGRVATDDGTTMLIALGWVAVIATLVAIVLTWLPANGRYAKAAK